MCISLMREHNKPGLAFLYFFHDFSHLNISSFLLISSGVFTFCQGYVFKSQHKRLAKVVHAPAGVNVCSFCVWLFVPQPIWAQNESSLWLFRETVIFH